MVDIMYTSGYSKTVYYDYDLDSDGISERVIFGISDNRSEASIKCDNLNGKVFNHWLLQGNWLMFNTPVFGDYNGNGFAEIYNLTIDSDSIFLDINKLMLQDGLDIKKRFVCKVGIFKDGKTDIIDVGGRLIDINGDGLAEYVFSMHGGYSKFPRQYIYYRYFLKSTAFVYKQNRNKISRYSIA